MIRHRMAAANARRIAVVEVPRSAVNRLGRIGTIRPIDWTLVGSVAPMDVQPYAPQQPFTSTGARNMTPPTDQSWMAQILARQANQRESTPGTLTWTPTPTPAPNISARWNSWAGPCASQAVSAGNGAGTGGSAGTGAAASSSANSGAAGSTEQLPLIVMIAAALGAAASAAYILNSLLD